MDRTNDSGLSTRRARVNCEPKSVNLGRDSPSSPLDFVDDVEKLDRFRIFFSIMGNNFFPCIPAMLAMIDRESRSAAVSMVNIKTSRPEMTAVYYSDYQMYGHPNRLMGRLRPWSRLPFRSSTLWDI